MKIRLGGFFIQVESKLVTADAQAISPQDMDRQPADIMREERILPIHVGARTLTPVIRFTTVRLIGVGQNAGGGIGFVRAQPVAIVERPASEAEARAENSLPGRAVPARTPIPDVTGRTLGAMLATALVIGLLIRLIRKKMNQ